MCWMFSNLTAPPMVEEGLDHQPCLIREGEGNIIVEYPGSDDQGRILSFVGCHMDVVTLQIPTIGHVFDVFWALFVFVFVFLI
ncbi:hypothetical protein Sjap_004574 [Stephania japonica]|uniref:Uncharacterized protein n=1 Tax=Stephania japonica TaxID=461633 RepID=A0AAP0PL15_9MAGN